MSSGWKVSDYAHASIFDPSDLDVSGGCPLPKPIFQRFFTTKEEFSDYCLAVSAAEVPPPSFWVPKKDKPRKKTVGTSASTVGSLRYLRNIYAIPESVQFRLPVQGQGAENPPPGYFTCYEAFLLNCQLWFPIPRAIFEFLDRFGVPFGQLRPSGLQHLVGILVLGYERGMSLDADYLSAMLTFKGRKGGFYLAPRRDMTVIGGLASNDHDWIYRFFYVKIDSASVEESCIPLIRAAWATNGILLT